MYVYGGGMFVLFLQLCFFFAKSGINSGLVWQKREAEWCIFATNLCHKGMKTLNIRTILDEGLNIHYNEHIAIFKDFEEVRHHKVPDVLVDGFLFALVTDGHAQLSVEDKTYQLNVGDIITSRPRIIFEKSMISMDFNALVVFLSPNYVEQFGKLVRMEWSHSMFSRALQVLPADEMTAERCRGYFSLLQNNLQSPETSNKELRLRLLLASLVYELIDLYRAQDDKTIQQTYSSGENILRRFMQHLHDPSLPYLNVNEYASLFCITPKYFSGICKRFTGRTANQLISDEIVRSAKFMLRDSSKSIKQIASSMGFKNQSHFGRFFRLQVGVSPQQYRDGKTQ